eukprot:TRINITY_DN17833_c0_g1_i2.p1 TRINITY_DN17833_c0_g1~~TRINITY_DN17833_c0_g1_i2.p1  ORF type:complete len:672 (+),score=184.31 TRINITY_DN17833_c0_g1_i2:44-2017(+)
MAPGHGPLSWIARHVALPDEKPAAVLQKVTWIVLSLVGVFGSLLATINGQLGGNHMLRLTGVFLPFFLAAIAYLMYSKCLTPAYLTTVTVAAAAGVTFYDFAVMPAPGWRGWALFVLVVDGMLIARAPSYLRQGVMGWVMFWLLFTSSEFALRWGLLDLPGTQHYADRVDVCEKPPCATGRQGFVQGLVPMIILLVDYKATAGFAMAVEAEKAKMERAVAVSQTVASCLAFFDLNLAEEALEKVEPGDMPEELTEAFSRLLGNLRSYRPYLPQAVMAQDECLEKGFSDDAGAVARTSSSGTNIHGPTSPASQPSVLAMSPEGSFRSSGSGGSSVGSPRPSFRQRANFAVVRHLKCQHATLLLATCTLAPGAVHPDLEMYADAHTAFLTEVLRNCTRGVLMHFSGERVYVSFNTFRRAASHASHGLSAATAFVDGSNASGRCGAHVAVATGAVLFGNLGNEASTSPNILSAMVHWLPQMITVGRELGEGVVCSAGTFGGVSVEFPLRVLLHRFVLACPTVQTGVLSHTYGHSDGQKDGAADALYILRTPPEAEEAAVVLQPNNRRRSTIHGRSSIDASEWLYTLALEPGKKWEVFNDAGKRWHRGGEAAGMAYIESAADVPEAVLAAFKEDTRRARVYDFRMRSVLVQNSLTVEEVAS